jgi:hypothetical protein
VTRVRKVLENGLAGNATAEAIATMRGLEQQAVNEAFGIGETPTDESSLHGYVAAIRKSSERITDHRKFAVDIMRAFDGMTDNKFVYFGQGKTKAVWQVSQFGDRAIATLVDGSPLSTQITLQQANGTWRISSLFNELAKGANQADKSNANAVTPSTLAMEMQQRLQGEWDVKVMGFSSDVSDKRPYQAVVRGQLFLLHCMEDGKVIGTTPFKMIWPEADHPDVVDIVWEPNNNSDADCAPGRITCDGKSFQLAFRSGKVSGKFERPTEICSGEGISYFECVRKQPIDPSLTSTRSEAYPGTK